MTSTTPPPASSPSPTAPPETTTTSPPVTTTTPFPTTSTTKTYYVKNGGNDNASGLSDAEAWATLRKVQNSRFNPGDSVLLKCGSRWNERLDFPSSGSLGKNILFSSYGSGDQPKMMRLYLSWKSYLTVSNIHMLGDRDYGACDVYNCHDTIFDGITADGQKIMDTYVYSLFFIYRSHHITLKNSTIKDGGHYIGTEWGGGLNIWTDCHDILVENNFSYNHANKCMECASDINEAYQTYNIVFRGNTCYNEEGYWDDCRGINFGWKTHDVIVENNKVFNTKTFLIGSDANMHHAIIRNNTLFYTLDSGYGLFISILANHIGDSSDTYVYNNSMFHLSRISDGAFIRLDTFDGHTNTGHRIYNNLCVTYNPDVAFIFDNSIYDYNTDTRLNPDYNPAWPKSEFTSDHNLFYSMVSPAKFMYQDVEYYGIDAWRAASGQDMHSIYANPGLKGIEDFTTVDKFSTSGGELLYNTSFDINTDGWGVYFNTEAGASGSFSRTTTAGEYYSAPAGMKIDFNTNTTETAHAMLYNYRGFSIERQKWYVMSFKAKASHQFRVPNIFLMQNRDPYTIYSTKQMGEGPMITTEWQTYHVFFYTNQAASDAEVSWFIGKSLPAGGTFYIDDVSFKLADGLNQILLDIEDFITPLNSPCVDAGIALIDVTDDFLGNHRPEGAGYDIGAYEVK